MVAAVELRQLRYFVAVAEAGNISHAAKKIFLTQPALSRQIKALEEEIGQCLLERQAHSIRLTPAGETLVREARELLTHAGQVLERVRETGRGLRLRVGYAPSLAAGILSPAVEVFTQAHVGVRVELFGLSTQEMLAGLAAGTLDVILTVGQANRRPGVKWIPLVRAPWKLAVSRRHPLAARKRVTPAEVAGEPLLVFCQRDYPEYWEAVTTWLRAHGQRPRIAGEHDGGESLVTAVASGLGVAIVAERPGRFDAGRIQLVALAEAPDPLCIAAGLRRDRAEDPALAVFAEELRKAAQAAE